MTKRTCEGCRFYVPFDGHGYGECRRHAPLRDGLETPRVGSIHWCGEWRDKAVTPEMEERRELVRRFAVAIITRGNYRSHDEAWKYATDMADAEPNS